MIFSDVRDRLGWLFRFPHSLRSKQKEKAPGDEQRARLCPRRASCFCRRGKADLLRQPRREARAQHPGFSHQLAGILGLNPLITAETKLVEFFLLTLRQPKPSTVSVVSLSDLTSVDCVCFCFSSLDWDEGARFRSTGCLLPEAAGRKRKANSWGTCGCCLGCHC